MEVLMKIGSFILIKKEGGVKKGGKRTDDSFMDNSMTKKENDEKEGSGISTRSTSYYSFLFACPQIHK